MKKVLLAVCVVALVFAVATTSSAQNKMALNIGANLMLPMGTFGDAQGIGIGGTVQGEYAFMPNLSGTVKTGYITWAGKDFSSGGVTVTGGSFHGIPILVGGKYYFMPPATGAMRFYGQAELGFFIGSVTVPAIAGVVIPGFGTIGGRAEETVSETDFAFSPSIGMEYPMGNGAFDANVNFLLISAASSATNIGVRLGYKFAI